MVCKTMSSEEGSEFLRKVLNAPKTMERRVSTHSLKSTALGWAAKYGLCEQSRAILARRTSTVANATAVYSRDLLSPVLREFDGVLCNIREERFEPDRSRSGMITPSGLLPFPGTPALMTPAGVPATSFVMTLPPEKPVLRHPDDQVEEVIRSAAEDKQVPSEECLDDLESKDWCIVGMSEATVSSAPIGVDMMSEHEAAEVKEEAVTSSAGRGAVLVDTVSDTTEEDCVQSTTSSMRWKLKMIGLPSSKSPPITTSMRNPWCCTSSAPTLTSGVTGRSHLLI